MLGQAAAGIGVECRFLDPAADACAGEVGELVVGAYDDPDALAGLPRAPTPSPTSSRTCPVAAARPRRRACPAPGARGGAGPAPREGALPAPRDPDRALRRPRGDRPAGARQEPPPRLRRQGAAPRRRRRTDRRGRDRGGAARVRPRALDRRRPWPRRRDALLAGDRERRTAAGSSASPAPPRSARRRPRPRRSRRASSTSSATSACSRSSCSTSAGGCVANEFAPRVHNSGHWTIDGARTSQFENHLRAILGLPLGATRRARRRP